MNWENFGRLYLYVMTENVKQIIRKHRHVLLSEDVKKKYDINESDITYALTLPALDEVYTRKIHNFPSVNDLYHWSSSQNYLQFIKRPMVFINSKDDPIVPEVLLEPIKNHASKHNSNPSLAWLNITVAEGLQSLKLFIQYQRYHMTFLMKCIFMINFRSGKHPNTLYVEVAHGGHLGFYEGGYIYPNPITWLDRATIGIIGGIVLSNKNRLMHKVEID